MAKPLGKERIVERLEEGLAFTAREAASLAFVSERVANRVLGELHDARKIFVADWERSEGCSRGKSVPVYQLGRRKDKERPAPLTDYEKRKRYLQRKMLAPDRIVRDRAAEQVIPWCFARSNSRCASTTEAQ